MMEPSSPSKGRREKFPAAFNVQNYIHEVVWQEKHHDQLITSNDHNKTTKTTSKKR